MSKVLLQNQRNNDELVAGDRGHNRNMKLSEQKHRNDVQKMKDEHQAEKESLKQQQHAAINHIRLNHDNNEREEMIQHRSNMSKLKLQQKAERQRNSLSQRELVQNEKIASETEKQNLHDMKSQFKAQQERTRALHEKRLREAHEGNRFKTRQHISRNQHQQRELSETHNKEMHRLTTTKEKELKETHHKYNTSERNQKQDHFGQLRKQNEFFQGAREHQGKHFRSKLKAEKEFSKERLKDQDDRYQGLFAQNSKANVQSLENQKNRYEEALFDVKKEFLHKAHFYEKRENDPFYQLLDIDAKFQEGPGYYEIEAVIPEHEMDNFKVRVQKDKISIFATRQHEQEFIKDNEKVGSQNAQTVRQEFSLLHPADPDQVVQTYDNGLLIVTVPKIGFVPTGQT